MVELYQVVSKTLLLRSRGLADILGLLGALTPKVPYLRHRFHVHQPHRSYNTGGALSEFLAQGLLTPTSWRLFPIPEGKNELPSL